MLAWMGRAAVVLAGVGLAATFDRARRERLAAEARAATDGPPGDVADARSTAPRHVDRLGEVGPQPESGAAPRGARGRVVAGGAVVVRAIRGALKANVTDQAAGLAYYGFLAVPSLLVVAVGVTGLVVDPSNVAELVDRLSSFAPDSAIVLIQDVLDRVAGSGGSGVSLIAVGTVFALWSATGAATALMRGFNVAYGRTESRGMIGKRLAALAVIAWLGLAVVVALGVIALGPVIADRIGDAVDQPGLVRGVWSGIQWPVAIVGLMVAFAGILGVGPDVAHPSWRATIPGAVFATVAWLLTSGLFSVYVANFGSYDAAWGSLSAVIVLLTWIWLSSLAILLGARVNAEAERSRELVAGIRAEAGLALPTRGEGSAGVA